MDQIWRDSCRGARFLAQARLGPYAASARANYALAAYSLALTAARADALTPQVHATETGMIRTFATARARDAAARFADGLADLGLRHQLLDTTELARKIPAMDAAPAPMGGAIFFEGDRVCDALAFTRALGRDVKMRGGEIRTDARVTGFAKAHGAITGVVTDQGSHTGRVILCTGAQTPQLVRALGLRAPIAPVKGYSLTLPWSEAAAASLPIPMVDTAQHIAITPFADRVRILGMAEFARDDQRVIAARVAQLRAFFSRLLPNLATTLDWAEGKGWAGLRPMSADGRPIIGPVSAGLWANYGHGHLGWTQALGSAALLADQITGTNTALDPRPFLPSRPSFARVSI